MKKYFIGSIALAAVIGMVSLVGAQTSAENSSSHSQPTVLQVGPVGNILMRGTLDSVSANSLTVKSWGGDWTVNISASTEVMPGGDANNFAKGDFVGVQGSVNQSASWTVDAKIVRDWTYKKSVNQQEQQNRHSTQQLMKATESRNWQGTAGNVNVSGNSLTLTVNGAAYMVNIASGAKLVNRVWQTITLDKVNSGDILRVWGPVANNTITASILRDISLPIKAGNK